MYAKGFQWVDALCEVENYAQAAKSQAEAEVEAEVEAELALAHAQDTKTAGPGTANANIITFIYTSAFVLRNNNAQQQQQQHQQLATVVRQTPQQQQQGQPCQVLKPLSFHVHGAAWEVNKYVSWSRTCSCRKMANKADPVINMPTVGWAPKKA